MKRILLLALPFLAVPASAETTYLGLYMQGSKIGYSSYADADAMLDGHATKRSDSVTFMDTALIGSALQIRLDSTTWTSLGGKPLRMKFKMESGGRTQKVDAVFGSKAVSLLVQNGKTVTKSSLPVPSGGTVVDDPLPMVLSGKWAVGTSKDVYVLDPLTVSFVKNQVKLVGPTKVTIKGESRDSTLIEIADPRATMRVFVTAKGDLLKVESAMGMEMFPVSRTVALGPNASGDKMPDLAFSTCIKPDKTIEAPRSLRGLKLKLTAKMSRLPSDEAQTVTPDGKSFVIDVHPVIPDEDAKTAEIRPAKIEWTKPSLNIPSRSPRFQKLAASIVGSAPKVTVAAERIRSWVYREMSPNAGIGVLRNANEVLDTKEGVCRDYATLTTTLLRAAGVPARLVAGIVYADGAFYYHAWAEAWDGKHWFGVDSTVPESRFSAAHVKLAQGNVDQAFTFTFLEGASISVLDARG